MQADSLPFEPPGKPPRSNWGREKQQGERGGNDEAGFLGKVDEGTHNSSLDCGEEVSSKPQAEAGVGGDKGPPKLSLTRHSKVLGIYPKTSQVPLRGGTQPDVLVHCPA